MESNSDPVCPVCTLSVRREIPLEEHLNTHPKDQVIRALITKCVPNLPVPPPLTPAPPTFQYIQSPPTPNNVAVQYPYSLIPIVSFPFGVPTQTSFIPPQTIFNGQTPRPAITNSGNGTVNIGGITINTNSAAIPITASVTTTAAGPVVSSMKCPLVQAPAVHSQPVAISEVLEIRDESRGTSEHESIIPEIPDSTEDELEEEDDGDAGAGEVCSVLEEVEGEVENDEHQLILCIGNKGEFITASPGPSSPLPTKKEDDEDEVNFAEHLSSLEQFSPKDTVSMRDIQTDETMPAQGELSEQESLGADTASLWGPAAEDVFSELASHGHAPSSHLLSDWPPLLGADLAEPTSSRDAAASSSSSSNNSSLLASEVFGGASEVKLEVKTEVKHETIEQLEQEAEKVLIAVMGGEESLLVQQSDHRRQRQCLSCHESFATLRELKLHRSRVHRRTVYTCTICRLEFSDRSEFHLHNKTHPLECLQCGKTFSKRPGLTLHMKRHLGVKPYKCTLCDKGFVTNQKLLEHMNGHTGRKPHVCKECGKAFKRHSNLIQHRNWVHRRVRKAPQDLMCDFCNKIFHTKRSMAWHLEIHLRKPRVCQHCPQRFVHMSSLTRHIRTMHDRKFVPEATNRPSRYVECPECFGVFCKTSLNAHMRTHNGDRPFACNICFKSFATKWNLQQHRWTHEGPTNRPLRCTMCRKSYFRKEDLECHIRAHKNQRPFCCDFCGQKFARRYNCIRHMREHIGEKQFACSVCPKSFHRSYYLKEHMRVHTGLKPWSCHICGKGSTTKSNHNKHVKTHHARESVTPEG